MSTLPRRSPDPNELSEYMHPLLLDLILWNAPDHEYTRRTVLSAIERALDEAFAVYEALGGDTAQGLTT